MTHSADSVALDVEQLKRQPLSIGVVAAAGGAGVSVIVATAVAVLYVGGLRDEASKNFAAVDRKADMLAQQIESAKTQRDLSMRNRDLQIDAIKSEQDRQGKRQDAVELVLQNLSRNMERVLVVVESLKERQDKQAAGGR